MSYEVDILAVGEGSKGGDAIALRFGGLSESLNDQKVVVIDGGYKESGEKLVNRIINEYNTSTVDLVISTHPDNDHLAGLHIVLEKLTVKELWLHRPWNSSDAVKKMAAEARYLTAAGMSTKLKKSLESAYDLEQLAIKKGIPIYEPFVGKSAFDGVIYILGPSEEFYRNIVGEFEKASMVSAATLLQKIKKSISEVRHRDALEEPSDSAVNARNNSSVITLVQLGDDHFLFVGDAGVPGLWHAVQNAESKGYDISANVNFLQVPHHGSKRNLGPAILNHIVGEIQLEGGKVSKTAFISAPPEGAPKHPSQRVINALDRRGATITATQGIDHYFHSLDLPVRSGWGPITPLTFVENYEEES